LRQLSDEAHSKLPLLNSHNANKKSNYQKLPHLFERKARGSLFPKLYLEHQRSAGKRPHGSKPEAEQPNTNLFSIGYPNSILAYSNIIEVENEVQ